MELANAENGWINTIDSKKPEIIEKARQIIKNTVYCTVATCSKDGFPWASPLLFVYDELWNIYWSSAITARHSQNIDRDRGRVAIALFNTSKEVGVVQGLFFEGTASEADPKQVESLIEMVFRRTGKQVNRTARDYLDDSPRRFYQFQPKEVWITGDRVPIGNQLVDTKIKLRLADLIEKQ
ncbi:MAG TPA: pyridoxamine 5'-phosphate oxidase family protein [Leptolyngbyaceae cyanobacterium]